MAFLLFGCCTAGMRVLGVGPDFNRRWQLAVLSPKPQVQEQLTEVTQIWASSRAFAAVRMDGRLVTWGDVLHGGDSSAVEGQLQCTPEPLHSAEASRCSRTRGICL